MSAMIDENERQERQRRHTANRVKRMRQLRARAGLVRLEVYVPQEHVDEIRRIARGFADEALGRVQGEDEPDDDSGS